MIDDSTLQILRFGAKAALAGQPEFRHAELGLFNDHEARGLDALVDLVKRYLALAAPPRPLCIAIFGAPGSGKSRLAKELSTLLASRELAALAQINLTQVASTDELGVALSHACLTTGGQVPFVFFDEFDSAYGGSPWGWLSWFLAPMQDGEFRSGGATVKMKRAVFVFAGGTASTFDGFGEGDRARFVAAKGPDFVSRLRGYVDIPGVNAEPHRDDRRAAVLWYQLSQRNITLHDDLRDALLHAARFKHGARSMEALVELLPRDAVAHLAQVQEQQLIGMHVDRGFLDPRYLRGSVGLSGGADDNDADLMQVWGAVSQALFREGAQVAYGGSATTATGLAAQLVEVVQDRPQPLVKGSGEWILTSPTEAPAAVNGMRYIPRPPVHDSELPQGLPPAEQKRWRTSLQWFRMRHQLELLCIARFAVGGRLDLALTERTKRFPGVAEELMLALAMGHPIYIAGHCGGGAQWAGKLLGLDRRWSGRPLGVEAPPLEIPADKAVFFRPPPFVDLPLTPAELIAFFERRALGSELWPDNGLTAEENRALFESKEAGTVARLVIKGLRTRFG